MVSCGEKVDEGKPGTDEGGPARMRLVEGDKRDILTVAGARN